MAPFSAALEELESELESLDARREKLTTAIETIRGLDDDAPPARARAAKPAGARRKARGSAAPVAAAPTKKGRKPRAGKLTDAQLANLQRRFEKGDGVEDLADYFAVKPGWIYYQAKKRAWKRAAEPKRKKWGAKSKPAETEAAITPVRMCTKCDQKTVTDPCAHCGAPWKRSA